MKKNFKTILALALCVLMIFGMTACAEEGVSETQETASVSVAASNYVAKNPFKENVKIAYVPNRASDSVGSAWGTGIENYLSQFDTVSFQIFDGEGSADTQIGIFADLKEQKYDAVIVQLVDSSAENVAIQDLIDAGIPVLSLNISPTIAHAAAISLSSYDAGIKQAELACEMAGYKGNVVIIGFPPEVAKLMGDNHIQAWYDVIEKYPDMQVLEEQAGDWTTEGGNEIMRDYLTKYDNIDIVMGGTDAMAEGCAMAIQAAGREGIQLWGSDGESKALEYIEQGLMTGTIYTDFIEMGKFASQLALYAIESDVDLNLQSLNADGTPKKYNFPSQIVTADNVGSITNRW